MSPMILIANMILDGDDIDTIVDKMLNIHGWAVSEDSIIRVQDQLDKGEIVP